MSYLSIFKEILASATTNPTTPKHIWRDLSIKWMPGKATIAKGVRRAGKSTLLSHEVRERAKSDHLIHINFSDERLAGLPSKHLGDMITAYEESIGRRITNDRAWFLFDEIQEVPEWEIYVDRLIRNQNYSVAITGSSAKLLSQEIATQMRGRSLQYEVFPFSFKEFLRAHNFMPNLSTSFDRLQLNTHLKNFLTCGGFPEVVLAPEDIRKMILNEYFETIFFRDIIERNAISNLPAAKELMLGFFNQHSSSMTINKSFEKLISSGHKIQKSFVTEVLKALNDCYALYTVPIFSESISKQNVNPKKIYAIDGGLVSAVRAGFSQNYGRLLEGAIFLELIRRGQKVWYFKSKGEVDFITEDANGKLSLIQVALNLDDESTRNREINSLLNAMNELQIKTGTIISLDIEGVDIRVPSNIEIISASKWLLSL